MIRTKRFIIILCCWTALFANCSEDKTIPDLSLQETDYVEFSMIDSELSDTRVFQIVGVGISTDQKKSFDISLKDRLPLGAEIKLPEDGILRGQSMTGEKLPVMLMVRETPAGKELDFTVKNVSATGCSEDTEDAAKNGASGCGGESACDLSCADACSVQFTYEFTAPVDSSEWLDIRYSLTPDKVKPGSSTDIVLKIRLAKKDDALRELKCKIALPEMIYGSKIKLLNFPEWMRYDRTTRYIILSKEIGDLEPETDFEITFQMESGKARNLIFPRLLQVEGEIKDRLLFPRISASKVGNVERSEKIGLRFLCSASMEITE